MSDDGEKVDVADLAAKLAAELGEGWRSAEGYHAANHDARLFGPDGEELHVVISGRYSWRRCAPGRVVLSSTMDRELAAHVRYNEQSRHEITLSPSKTPGQIAREVQRRLLPDYRRVLTLARERKARHDEANATAAALLAEIDAALGIGSHRQPRGHSGDREELFFGHFGRGVSGRVQVLYGDDVEFESLRVPRAVAVELAAVIGRLHREGGEQS